MSSSDCCKRHCPRSSSESSNQESKCVCILSAINDWMKEFSDVDFMA